MGLDWVSVWVPITADVSINLKIPQKSNLFGYRFI